jgi:hypothetical protein
LDFGILGYSIYGIFVIGVVWFFILVSIEGLLLWLIGA